MQSYAMNRDYRDPFFDKSTKPVNDLGNSHLQR